MTCGKELALTRILRNVKGSAGGNKLLCLITVYHIRKAISSAVHFLYKKRREVQLDYFFYMTYTTSGNLIIKSHCPKGSFIF